MNSGEHHDPGLLRHIENSPSQVYSEKNADPFASGLVGRLREVLRGLDFFTSDENDQPGAHGIEALHEELVALQNAYMETLYEAMAEADIDSGHKLTLRLDEKAKLRLFGTHPSESKVKSLLDSRPDLAESFAGIALRSALLRDLRNLQLSVSYEDASQACMALLASSTRNGYQLSLKGDMNHFYFSR
ncbi:hypothetical protein LJB81_02215 [Desulfovibrio sp. OttesenSCG-928-M14]|nr:hypothetical protein [Desulfovibrio sp. OttesenSCG-928-M16]MDL2216531.1 hypothetical protein [Desulfovibrio sp. OttesenSCG-928-M14]